MSSQPEHSVNYTIRLANDQWNETKHIFGTFTGVNDFEIFKRIAEREPKLVEAKRLVVSLWPAYEPNMTSHPGMEYPQNEIERWVRIIEAEKKQN